jgi:uracil-DNA glycosylase family 4
MDAHRRRALEWLDLGPVLLPRTRAGIIADHDDDAGHPAPPASVHALQAGLPAPQAGLPAPQAVVHAPGTAADAWEQLQAEVRVCTACELSKSRRQTVFGVGPRTAGCMIIGEAPGAEEDARGEPFVGQAGRLLDQMLAAIDLTRERDVFICNVLKCRPPGNRNPTPGEVAACAGFLRRQIDAVRPKVLLLLGGFAVRSILETDASVGSQRGKVHRRRFGDREVPVIVSYHPAYLLRNLPEKRKSWEDLLLLSEQLAATRDPSQT